MSLRERERDRAVVGPCVTRRPGFPGDGGSPVRRWGEGQLPNRLPEDRRGHGTCTAAHLQQRRGATSSLWGLFPLNATWAWARDCSPAVQCYTYPSWIRTREVSLALLLDHNVAGATVGSLKTRKHCTSSSNGRVFVF